MQTGLTANGLTNGSRVLIVECAPAGTFSAGICATTGQQVRVRIQYPYTFRILRPIVAWACGAGCASSFGTITIASTTIMRKE
jgi:hypothetical protein